MAQQVQYELEKMLPELADLKERDVFDSHEISQIIQKRKELEYKIHRRISLKNDFKRYLKYEIALQQLSSRRKERQKKNWTLSDYSMVRRIHNLYQKTLKKFRGDVPLWVEYFDWCKTVGSTKVLARSFGKAIQMHPTKSLFWIMAAKWEWEENCNIAGARVLMQRGLRIIPKDQKLWLEYFKLELLWLTKLSDRKTILFGKEEELKVIGEDFDGEVDKNINIPVLEIEESSQNEEDVNIETNQNNAIIDVLIPRVIFKNSILSIDNDINFRHNFIKIYQQFDLDTTSAIDEIYATIENDFDTVESYKILAERFVSNIDHGNSNFPFELKKSVESYKSRIESSKTSSELSEFYSSFLITQSKLTSEPNLVIIF
jgi:U3 small nucleolar RNA-associated protein 6